MRDRRLFVAAGLGALLTVAVYWNSLSNGLVNDDVSAIEQNEAIRNPLDWRRIVLESSWVQSGRPTSSYRPLTTWTFAVNYAVHGTAPFGYHFGNVLGHALVTALLVALAAATGLSAGLAGLAGILFAVHPIHTEVVANGVGRAEIVAAAFALLALLLGRRAAETGWHPRASVAAASAYALALLAKEHTVALLVVMPLADLLLTDSGSVRGFAARLSGRRCAFYVALVAVTGGYLTLRAVALGRVMAAPGGGFEGITLWANPAASAPLPARILTALRVLAMAVGLLVWPHGLSADYSYRQIPVVDSVRTTAALAGCAVALGLTLLAVVLWGRRPLACFWLLFALATYGVVSNVLFPVATIFGERLLYLPSAGFCVLVALVLGKGRSMPARAIGTFVVVVALVDWSAVTIARNRVWHDAISLGLDMVRTAPDSAHAHHFLGATYQGEGRDEEALAELSHALEIYPEHLSSLYDVGLLHQRHGDGEAALAVYR
ncbi:MAG: DUF1736 domain-containing protein, partial [Deltaproteobacteria bacterium]